MVDSFSAGLLWGVIADDVAGGLDAGVAFVTSGETLLRLPDAPEPNPLPRSLVLDTESRRLPPQEAWTRAAGAAWRLRELGAVRVYKKIDSTLRGAWAWELEAARVALEAPSVLVAPAFPAVGRTTRGGRVYVGGVPLEATPVGTSSHVVEHLCALGRPVGHLHLSDVRADGDALADRLVGEREAGNVYIVADAEREEDLLALTRAAARANLDRLSCGSGGLAAAWAALGPVASCPSPSDSSPPLPAPVLVVAASRQPITHRQLVRLIAETRASCFWFGDEPRDFELARAVADVRVALGAGRPCVMATEPTDGPDRPQVAVALAQAVRDGLAAQPLGTLVVIGGETAFCLMRAVEADGVRLRRQRAPGLPEGTLDGGLWDGVTVVTKAGGFGDEETLVTLLTSPGER